MSANQISVAFEGIPVPWAAHQGYGRKSFNPKYKEKSHYRWQLKNQCPQMLLVGPISVEATYEMPIPKALLKKKKDLIRQGLIFPIKRPDLDNLNKFLLDVLKEHVFVDDSQVVEILAKKIYSDHPQTIIHIKPL